MTTKLTSPFKRELDLKGEKYTVTLSPEGFKLVQKGKRKGVELAWSAILNGDAECSAVSRRLLLHPLHDVGRSCIESPVIEMVRVEFLEAKPPEFTMTVLLFLLTSFGLNGRCGCHF